MLEHSIGHTSAIRLPGAGFCHIVHRTAKKHTLQAAAMSDAETWRANLIRDPAVIQQVWVLLQ